MSETKVNSQEFETVDSLNTKMNTVRKAQEIYANFSQEEVDKIFKAVALAACKQRIPLARMAAEETGMGVIEDKVIKNHYASEYIYHQYKDTKTCGLIEEDRSAGIRKIAEPMGLIAAIIPATNPTSTAIFKTLLALKTRNGIILMPPKRAKQCVAETGRILQEAAVKAGAPEGIIAWIEA
ncbi:MAG: aldehyde dehydrogenase family protein, partial [Coriobacteriia bacterium]|nr:aldehyde dehydrogenase family protein [Coriobacteriia bacterium]